MKEHQEGFSHHKPDRAVAYWLFSGCLMVALILIVGGLTRLYDAGLSITEWDVIGGVVPPTTEQQWEEAFETYKQFPEYQDLKKGMSMYEFKWIYWWEYLHRMLARALGFVFLIPFLIFAFQKRFNATDYGKLGLVVALGAFQALMGWYMVYSGLVDEPYVSHFRLMIHLALAFIIFWVLFRYGLTKIKGVSPNGNKPPLYWLTVGVTGILFLQVLLGALTAGLDAGHYYSSTFPKMGEYWVPPQIGTQGNLFNDLVNNPVSVQFLHRNAAYLLFFVGIYYWYRTLKSNYGPTIRNLSHSFMALLLLQVILGVLTLFSHAYLSLEDYRIGLASIHQFMAMVIFAILIWMEKELALKKE